MSVLYPAFLSCGEANTHLEEEMKLYGFSYKRN